MWQSIKMFYRWPEKVEHIFQFYNSIFIYALFRANQWEGKEREREKKTHEQRANYNSFSCFPSIFLWYSYEIQTTRLSFDRARMKETKKNMRSLCIVE